MANPSFMSAALHLGAAKRSADERTARRSTPRLFTGRTTGALHLDCRLIRARRRAPWAVALAIAALTSSIVAGGHAGAGNGLTSDQVADQIIAVQDDAD